MDKKNRPKIYQHTSGGGHAIETYLKKCYKKTPCKDCEKLIKDNVCEDGKYKNNMLIYNNPY